MYFHFKLQSVPKSAVNRLKAAGHADRWTEHNGSTLLMAEQ